MIRMPQSGVSGSGESSLWTLSTQTPHGRDRREGCYLRGVLDHPLCCSSRRPCQPRRPCDFRLSHDLSLCHTIQIQSQASPKPVLIQVLGDSMTDEVCYLLCLSAVELVNFDPSSLGQLPIVSVKGFLLGRIH
jgi:hypothetical protein